MWWEELKHVADENGQSVALTLARVTQGLLTIPHSSAGCKRIFSVVRQIRTDQRSCLKENTLEVNAPRLNLLKVAMESKFRKSEEATEETQNECEDIDLSKAAQLKIEKTVYQFYVSASTSEKKQIHAEIFSLLSTLLGPDRLASAMAAVRARTHYATVLKTFRFGTGVMQALLWYLILESCV
ncbi:hypothetical protein PoB_004303700 [Plakobranchus ocellatus]|uniref:HAT C-terminal dimerisation domain-containing protein n=1 Tax=Plakobranchus ocellatus TaxID=259542 RepID=A0AAV4BBM0_9GAST|nr:hypothetical protein PoB_004303700 [Plakobranchus ocellatus]